MKTTLNILPLAKRRHVAIACLSSLFAPMTLSAQTLATNDTETITITGSRLPVSRNQVAASTDVLTREDIVQAGAVQITDLLRGLPGITIAQSGSIGALTEIRVRGSESNHILVLIDGVIANDVGQGGLIDLAHLTSTNVARIEFTRGPQSALWGSGAIGGVLSITTLSQADDVDFNLALSTGTQGTQQVSLSGQHSTKTLTLRAHVDGTDTDGNNISQTGTEEDGYQNLTAGLGANWRINAENTLDISLRYTDFETEFDGVDFVSTGLPSDADNLTEGNQTQLAATWRYTPQDSDYSSSLFVSAREDESDSVNSGFDAGGTTGTRLQATWLNTFQLNAQWQWVVGADWIQRLFEQRGVASPFGDPNQTQHDTTHAVVTEVNGQVTSSLTVNASARYDNNSEFDNALSWRAGATWQWTPELRTFVSAGEAIKNPTFTERFGFFPGSFQGNMLLQPESSQDIEIGLNWTFLPTWEVSLSAFQSDLTDEILGFVFDPVTNNFTADNAVGDSERQGAELSLSGQLPYSRIQMSYSYLDATESQVADGPALTELRRAEHQGAVTLYTDIPDSQWSGYLKVAYTGSRDDIFFPPGAFVSERVGLDAYFYTSANITYRITPDWQLGLRLENALDEDYEDVLGFSGNPRSALFTVRYQPVL